MLYIRPLWSVNECKSVVEELKCVVCRNAELCHEASKKHFEVNFGCNEGAKKRHEHTLLWLDIAMCQTYDDGVTIRYWR